MKQLSIFLLALVVFAAPAAAQINPAKGVQNVVINTPTVQCEQCKARIEKYLSHEEGILKVEVDYKKKITKVRYLADRTNVENIKTLIANAGYDADDITAEPDSYKRLPICCKPGRRRSSEVGLVNSIHQSHYTQHHSSPRHCTRQFLPLPYFKVSYIPAGKHLLAKIGIFDRRIPA